MNFEFRLAVLAVQLYIAIPQQVSTELLFLNAEGRGGKRGEFYLVPWWIEKRYKYDYYINGKF